MSVEPYHLYIHIIKVKEKNLSSVHAYHRHELFTIFGLSAFEQESLLQPQSSFVEISFEPIFSSFTKESTGWQTWVNWHFSCHGLEVFENKNGVFLLV